MYRVTTDYDTIRAWVEKHGGRPAIVAHTNTSDSLGVLGFKFNGGEWKEISWREFFDRFEAMRVALRYRDPVPSGEEEITWEFASRDALSEDETRLPEEYDMAQENMFSSSEPSTENE